MKRKAVSQKFCVRTLPEVDALIGLYLTGEKPRVQWINVKTDFRFDSIEEAVESMEDPFFRELDKEAGLTSPVLMEVHEYRMYSSDLSAAWELVDHLTHRLEPLLVRRYEGQWESAFGDRKYITAPSAPLAICLAALRSRGLEVECRFEPVTERVAVGVPDATIRSLYSRP